MAETALRGPVRVRFAPSPTGYLHVGGARTAIYNELLRRSLGGALILRIEDTDQARSDEAMTALIVSGLEWVGVEIDEGPFLQSERLGRHRERAEELLAAGRAYRCFCGPDAHAGERRRAEAEGRTFRYPRTCLPCAGEESDRRAAAGEPFVVRLRMPDEPIRFADMVRGEVEFAPEVLDDFILLRTDGSPTYHLSVVVDDVDMEVTHVLRGEDHLSNTPKHVALFRALGELGAPPGSQFGAPPGSQFGAPRGRRAELPRFGHLPLILGPDKKRLSKRTGAASVEEFRDAGILPQALYNYLALLGWSPGDDTEVMDRDELARRFTVERLNASAAVFDRDKLAWLNARYVAALPLAELWPHLEPFLAEAGLADADRARLERAVELHRVRAGDLRELAGQLAPYFAERIDYDPELCARFVADPELPDRLDAVRNRFAAVEPFAVEPLERELRALAEELGVKAAALIHPLRMALSGTPAGPGVFDLVELQGRERTAAHLERFTGWLRERQRG